MARSSTIRDVARLAGVSIATVSRTLSNPAVVAEQTRESVLRAVVEAGYQPNALAISLRRLQSRAVVVLVSDIANPFYAEVFKGAEESAHRHGYSVLIGDLSTDPDKGASYVELVRGHRADGIIMMNAGLPREAADATAIPMVYAATYDPAGKLPSVSIDYAAATRAATDHLIALGHRRIAHISGDLRSPSCRDKRAGYRQALEAAGLPQSADLEYEGDDSIAAGAAGLTHLLGAPEPPTAVFAANDEMAIGAIRALTARGLRVPEDFSVVGFDDIKFAAAYAPAITTVRLPRFDIGVQAMEMIIRRLTDPDAPGLEAADPAATRIELPTELIVRDSAGPPPAPAS